MFIPFEKRVCVILLWILFIPVFSQSTIVNSADTYFKNESYAEALPLYEKLLESQKSNSTYNYRLGVCLFQTHGDYEKAIAYLKIARTKGIRLANFYLGRCYYRLYQFDEAIESYNKYLSGIRADHENYGWVKDEIEKCKDLQVSLNRTEDVEILSATTVPMHNFFDHYKLSKESGKILNTSDVFMGTDTNFVMYKNERGDRICYPRILNDTLDTDLFKKNKLLNSWGAEERLSSVINSFGNELYPYILDDGITMFFSSNGHGGMGGYDIFVTRYNPETQTYMPPANLGMPFNSIGNDYLYVVDEFSNVGWFASDRNNVEGEITVYSFVPSETKKVLKADRQTLIAAARLIFSDTTLTDSISKQKANLAKRQVKPFEEDRQIYFVLNDTVIYRSTKQFVSAAALQLFKFGEIKIRKLDELKAELRMQREDYPNVKNPEERKAISDLIVELEDQIFKIDSQTEDPFQVARNKELRTLEENNWQFYNRVDYDALLMQTDAEKLGVEKPSFIVPAISDRYKDIFSGSELDSLMKFECQLAAIKRRIKNLKSAEELFTSSQNLDHTTTYFWRSLRQIDTAFVYGKQNEELLTLTENCIKDATQDMLRVQLNRIQALHQKVNRFIVRMRGIDNQIRMMEFIDKGLHFSNMVKDTIDKVSGSAQTMENLQELQVKANKSQEMFEYAMLYYIEDYGGSLTEVANIEVADTLLTAPKVDSSMSVVVAQSEPDTPVFVKKDTIITPSPKVERLTYKIQIGIFTQKPAQNLLNKIPPVETVEIPEKNIVKYFSGVYTDLNEARKMAKEIDSAGFKGAFVVPFIDNVAVTWKDANNFK